jgi:hypothetical protein
VSNPPEFRELLEEEVENGLELRLTMFQVLDKMERLAKKDLRDFLKTQGIDLPPDRRERALDEVLKETGGHYEQTLEELKTLVERAWRKI